MVFEFNLTTDEDNGHTFESQKGFVEEILRMWDTFKIRSIKILKITFIENKVKTVLLMDSEYKYLFTIQKIVYDMYAAKTCGYIGCDKYFARDMDRITYSKEVDLSLIEEVDQFILLPFGGVLNITKSVVDFEELYTILSEARDPDPILDCNSIIARASKHNKAKDLSDPVCHWELDNFGSCFHDLWVNMLGKESNININPIDITKE